MASPSTSSDLDALSQASLSPREAAASTLSSATEADESADTPDIAAGLTPEQRCERAQAAKAEGNAHFVAAKYEDAKDSYSRAITFDPTVAVFFSNRSACELKLEQFGLAIEDAGACYMSSPTLPLLPLSLLLIPFFCLFPFTGTAVKLDPKLSKAFFRRATGHLALLDPKAALPDLKKCQALTPKDPKVRATLDSTNKLIRRLAFEKAIKKDDEKPVSVTVAEYLFANDGSAGTAVPAGYEGPRIEPAPTDATEQERVTGRITQQFVSDLIEFFKSGGHLPLRFAWQIMLGAKFVLDAEPSLVEYEIPKGQTVDVVGDTHGQFYDFVHLLTLTGTPSPAHAVLFNGDFVDRGSWSIEVVLTMLAYKWLYPHACLMNRGNHEVADLNKMYGFEGECKAKYGGPLTFNLFSELFTSLPLATLLSAPEEPLPAADLPAAASHSPAQLVPILTKEVLPSGERPTLVGRKRYFVVHGGLSSEDNVSLADVRAIERRKKTMPADGLMHELLWSDPQVAPGRGPSKRGTGLGFGPDVTRAWCEYNGVTGILRSHEVRQGGYAEEHSGLCTTVFSAPNYCDQMGNQGAFARIDDRGTLVFSTFDAQPHPPVKAMAYASQMMMSM